MLQILIIFNYKLLAKVLKSKDVGSVLGSFQEVTVLKRPLLFVGKKADNVKNT